MVKEAGIYMLSLGEYVLDPAPKPSLNAGAAHTLLTHSPLHAWHRHPRLNPNYRADESSRLDLGTIAHALLLEDDASRIVVIDAEDWRTKEAKSQRDEARAQGKCPILQKDYESVAAMVTEARFAIVASEFNEDFQDAIPEQTLIWEHDGVWCRSRPDKATSDWRILFDYKTVAGSASPQAFLKSVIQQGYDLQAELAVMGVEALVGETQTTFVFIVQEIEPPYSVSFVSLSPAWQDLARRKLKIAMSTWKGCLRKNKWPSYRSDVAYLDPPAYAALDWEDNLTPIDAEDFV